MTLEDALRYEVSTYPTWLWVIRLQLFGEDKTAIFFAKRTIRKLKLYNEHCEFASQDFAVKEAQKLVNHRS